MREWCTMVHRWPKRRFNIFSKLPTIVSGWGVTKYQHCTTRRSLCFSNAKLCWFNPHNLWKICRLILVWKSETEILLHQIKYISTEQNRSAVGQTILSLNEWIILSTFWLDFSHQLIHFITLATLPRSHTSQSCNKRRNLSMYLCEVSSSLRKSWTIIIV